MGKSISQGMDKQDTVYPHNELLFSHKMNEVLVYDVMWMKLGNTTQSKRNQIQKTR